MFIERRHFIVLLKHWCAFKFLFIFISVIFVWSVACDREVIKSTEPGSGPSGPWNRLFLNDAQQLIKRVISSSFSPAETCSNKKIPHVCVWTRGRRILICLSWKTIKYINNQELFLFLDLSKNLIRHQKISLLHKMFLFLWADAEKLGVFSVWNW